MPQQDDIKKQLAEARRLARTGNIKEARTLLGGIDHPKAKEWLGLLPTTFGSRSGLSYPIAGIALVVVAVIAIGLGILIGRETLRQQIASVFTGVGSQTALATGSPGGTEFEAASTGVASTLAAMQITPTAVPAGIEMAGSVLVKVMTVERPTKLRVTSMMGSDMAPTVGTEYVGVQLEITCPASEVTCFTGIASPSLSLTDGRVVYPVEYVPDAGDDSITGGNSLIVWRVYEVPIEAKLSNMIYERSIGDLPH